LSISTQARHLECRRRRVADECGWPASEWQLQFSSLLSGTKLKTMDVAYHPTTQEALYVDDAQKERIGKL